MATASKTATRKSTAATKTTRSAVAKPAATKKAVSKPAAKPAAKPAPVEVKIKHKLVRDSFTIPKAEYVVLDSLKVRAAELKRPTKKSELIRAGIAVLKGMSDKEFLAAVNSVQSLKTGRPKLTSPKNT
jgi:zona occludens toxin (predicted ATPase)